MSPVAAAEPDGAQRNRCVSKLIFFLFVFGAMLLCVGVLLSIFGFQACQYRIFQDCSVVLKVAGPACAAVGLGAVILARSRARLQLRESRLRGSPADPDRDFLCGESRQFVQCLIFGFLFLTSGMLISILGIWVPGCGSDWAQEALNETDSADTEPQMCGFLSLQIMGPLIVLMGLCFFVVAHVKRNNLHEGQDASENEDPQIRSLEPVQVTVGTWLLVLCSHVSRWRLHQGFTGWPSLWPTFSLLSVPLTHTCTQAHTCVRAQRCRREKPQENPSACSSSPSSTSLLIT